MALSDTGQIASLFADFGLATGPTEATRKRDIVNDIQRNTYFQSFIQSGALNFQDMFRGGESIKDMVILDEDSTYKHYSPSEELTYRSSEVGTDWKVHWRFTTAQMQFTDHEVELNSGGGGDAKAMFHQFKELMRPKEINFNTSISNGMEDDWWAQPNAAGMETATGKTPYSLPCFVNEYDTSISAFVSTTGLPPGFSTIQQIDPAAKPKWNCYRTEYSAQPAAGWDGFSAFRRAMKRTQFKRMPKRGDLTEGETHPQLIITSEEGGDFVEQALSLSNDPLAAASKAKADPGIMDLHYKGIPIEWFEGMSTGTFYVDGNGSAVATYVPEFTDSTDSDGNLLTALANVTAPTHRAGPRFGFIDNRYIRQFFKQGRMFKTTTVTPERQPWKRVVVADMWQNRLCRSARRHAWVTPGAVLTRL